MKYTGELFGVEYLYNQTGKSLSMVKSDTEVEDEEGDEEEVDDDEVDEGVGDEIEDLTVSMDVNIMETLTPVDHTQEIVIDTEPQPSTSTARSPSPSESSSDTDIVSSIFFNF